jgi:hypothetical protein
MKVSKNRYFAYRSFWPEIETMKKFRDCGVDTFMFMVSNVNNSLGTPYTKYPPVWKWNGVYDLEPFDQQVGDILKAIPDAKLMCMVDLNTPQWWTRYLGAFGVRYDTFYELGKISPSPTWRNDVSDYLQLVLEHAEKNYSSHMVSYLLGCGGATEWHDRSRGEESVYRLAAWQEWQRAHGMTPDDIPGRIERDTGSYDFSNDYKPTGSYYNGIDPTGCYDKLFPQGVGLLRTPEKNRAAIDYWRFCNEFNADTVEFLLGKARKKIRPEAELGAFFGYGFGWWTMTSGHLAYESLLDSPNLDFFMAPISYTGRGMGCGSTCATVRTTINRKGKRMLQEMDQRTFSSNRKLADYFELPGHSPKNEEKVEWNDPTDSKELSRKFALAADGTWKNEREVVTGMKRDMAFSLIHGDSLWWFDMWGGFYQGEKVYENLRRMKEIWDEEIEYQAQDVAEILMVMDPENMYLLNDMDSRCGLFHEKTLAALSVCDLPYMVCSFGDIEHLNISMFKLVIFCHPFMLTENHRRVLAEKVLKEGRSVLWLYGPGVVREGKWNPGNVETACGTPFKTPGLNRVSMKEWTSLYLHDPLNLTVEMMREMAVEAGCHAYCSHPRPVSANSRLLSLHTGKAEVVEVIFPRRYGDVMELFSGKTYRDVSNIEVATDGADTFLFRVKD